MILNGAFYKKSLVAFLCLFLFSLGFVFGVKFGEFSYLDRCLDAGGGINPEVSFICLVKQEKSRYERKVGEEFVCDEKGNIFINTKEASRFYKNPGAYGATYCDYFIAD